MTDSRDNDIETKRRNGGSLNYDNVTGAHVDIVTARDSLLGPGRKTAVQVMDRHVQMIRRTVWFIGRYYAGVHPNELGEAFRRAERKWVKEMQFSKTLRGRIGGRLLFEELKGLGLRDPDLLNPFEYEIERQREVLTPPLPIELATARTSLEKNLGRLVEMRRDTLGKQGIAAEWQRAQLRAFDDLIRFMIEHNAKDPQAVHWQLDLASIFSDPEIIASYLWAGQRRAHGDGDVSQLTRQYRKTALMAAYNFFQWKGLAPAGFPEKLNNYLRQGTSQMQLGGRSEKVIQALDERDVAAIRAHLANEIARVERAHANHATARTKSARAMVHRRNALFEYLLGTSVREQGAASLDERRFGVTKRGSHYVDEVKVKQKGGHKKAGEETYYRRQWLPRRSLDAIVRYMEATDRVLAVEPGDRAVLGPRLTFETGDLFAGTPMAESCERYPVFRQIDGQAMAPAEVGEVVARVLRRARVACDRAHVLRHTACAIAINDWHVSPTEAARVFGWATVAMVLERYSKGPIERIWEKFDALAEGEVLASGAVTRLVEALIVPLQKLLIDLRDKPTGNAVPLLWGGLVEALCQIQAMDPSRPSLRDGVLVSLDELARINLWISTRSDRHESASSVAGRELTAGLTVPQLPIDTEDDDGDEGAAAVA